MKNEALYALVDAYLDAEERNDDLTCMASYDKSKELGYSEEQWRNAYNHCWKAREDAKWIRKRERQKQMAADRNSA